MIDETKKILDEELMFQQLVLEQLYLLAIQRL